MPRKPTFKPFPPKPHKSIPSEAFLAEMEVMARLKLDAQLPDENATMAEIEEAAGKIGQEVSEEIKKGGRIVALD